MYYKSESLRGLPDLQEDSKLNSVFSLRGSNMISFALRHLDMNYVF